jgi:hypothetical protein
MKVEAPFDMAFFPFALFHPIVFSSFENKA